MVADISCIPTYMHVISESEERQRDAHAEVDQDRPVMRLCRPVTQCCHRHAENEELWRALSLFPPQQRDGGGEEKGRTRMLWC